MRAAEPAIDAHQLDPVRLAPKHPLALACESELELQARSAIPTRSGGLVGLVREHRLDIRAAAVGAAPEDR